MRPAGLRHAPAAATTSHAATLPHAEGPQVEVRPLAARMATMMTAQPDAAPLDAAPFFQDEAADLVFVDGDHRFEQVVVETEQGENGFRCHRRPNGLRRGAPDPQAPGRRPGKLRAHASGRGFRK